VINFDESLTLAEPPTADYLPSIGLRQAAGRGARKEPWERPSRL